MAENRYWLKLYCQNGPATYSEETTVTVVFCPECGSMVLEAMIGKHPHPIDSEAESLAEIEGRMAQPLGEERMRKPGNSGCKANHGISVWPYVARCVLVENHPQPYDHTDKHGNQWHAEPCDGCRLIERKRESLKPGDETEHYELRRMEKRHLKECPNRKED